jgi:AraC family transcriptional regulator of adaptative response / DNA-3-methyladenine glycosylase II
LAKEIIVPLNFTSENGETASAEWLMRLRRLFDLDAIPEEISSHLGSLAEAHPGLRVPGAFDGFEMAVRAILGQQISVKAATTLAARLTERFADSVVTPFPALARLGPRAGAVSEIPAGQLAAIGLTRSRVKSILALAHAVATGAISFDPTVPVDRVMMKLKELPGIGAKGQLVGYGGGLDRKRALLQFDAIVRDFGPQPLMPRRNPFPGTGAGSS